MCHSSRSASAAHPCNRSRLCSDQSLWRKRYPSYLPLLGRLLTCPLALSGLVVAIVRPRHAAKSTYEKLAQKRWRSRLQRDPTPNRLWRTRVQLSAGWNMTTVFPHWLCLYCRLFIIILHLSMAQDGSLICRQPEFANCMFRQSALPPSCVAARQRDVMRTGLLLVHQLATGSEIVDFSS